MPVTRIWDDDCLTDIDNIMYLGTPVNEVVFYFDDVSGQVKEIRLSAFDVTLTRSLDDKEEEKNFVSGEEEEEHVVSAEMSAGQVVLDA